MLEFPCDVQRLANGNTLITDGGDETAVGSEIIEVDRQGQVVWRFAEGLKFAHSAKRLRHGNTLITDTTNNRLLEVSPEGQIVLNSEDWCGGTGRLSDGSHLNYPNDAHELQDGSILVTDRNNDRCIIVDRAGEVLWSFSERIEHPHNADPLPNGDILLTSSVGNRVLEVNRQKEIVWSYGDGSPEILCFPRDADRLPNGNTLITDSRNHRVIEVTPDGKIVWAYQVDYYASFYQADRLRNGSILVSDQHHHQILEVNPYGEVTWQFRNRRFTRPFYPRLENGFFKERGSDGLPVGWWLYNRFAEGGGRVIWDEANAPRPCPGLAYDRYGALCLAQYVAVQGGHTYTLAGKIRTQGVEADRTGCFQLFFLDGYGGPVCSTAEAPTGFLLTGTSDWRQDTVEARAPEHATAVEVRLLINGPGKVWMKELMLFR
jgi:hypothetical protein